MLLLLRLILTVLMSALFVVLLIRGVFQWTKLAKRARAELGESEFNFKMNGDVELFDFLNLPTTRTKHPDLCAELDKIKTGLTACVVSFVALVATCVSSILV